MRAVLRASLEELVDGCSKQMERLKDMRRVLDEVSATASRRDDL